MKHNYLVLNSESGWETGVSLHSCARAVVSTNKIESPEDQARIWHVNTGLMLSENIATQLNLIELTGLRIGVKITNKLQVWPPISCNILFQRVSVGKSSGVPLSLGGT